MTPDDDREARRIDGLLASYGELMAAQAAQAERLTSHDREIVGIRTTGERLVAAIEKVDEHCAVRVQAVRDDIKAEATKAEARKDRLQLTTLQRAGLFIAAVGPLLTAVAMVAK